LHAFLQLNKKKILHFRKFRNYLPILTKIILLKPLCI